MKHPIFDGLFVLELANNHWGDLRRGVQIIKEFGALVEKYEIKAAIKLQFRNADTLIHESYKGRTDIRYIQRTEARILSKGAYRRLVDEIRSRNMIAMSTPFDEESVDFCEELDLDIIKIASFDLNDWPLVEKVLEKRRPTIVSIGGTEIDDIDTIVKMFNEAKVPLAINQCVSIYPTEPWELELNQIDLLVRRYPDNVIGLSTHEYKDYAISVAVGYGKGARTFERHIDIPHPTHMSAYNMLPEQCETWFKTYKMIIEMCGAPGTELRVPPKKEIDYINEHVRGLFARRDLSEGETISMEICYLAIPVHRGQLSCREVLMGGRLKGPVAKDGMVMLDNVDSDQLRSPKIREEIINRGREIDQAQ